MKKCALLFFLCSGALFSSAWSQEVRIQGHLQVLGTISDAFTGFGVGLESGLGKRMTLAFDFNTGHNDIGRSLEFRPAVHYYLSRNQMGLYVGPALKYIHLKEDDNQTRYRDHLYALGFNLGVKSDFLGIGSFGFNLSPHVTVGGQSEANVAGMSAQLFLGFDF